MPHASLESSIAAVSPANAPSHSPAQHDGEAHAGRALDALASNATPETLLGAVRALVPLGVAGLALRVIQKHAALLPEPDRAELVRQLQRLPSGEVESELGRARSAENRTALRECGILTRSNGAAIDAPSSHVHFFRTTQGNLHAIHDESDRPIVSIFPFIDHRNQMLRMKFGAIGERTSWLLIGVPSPALLARVLELNCDSGYQPPLDLIEPNVDVIYVWLQMVEIAELVRSGRLTIFAGANGLRDYQQVRSKVFTRHAPSHTLTNHRPGWNPPRISAAFQQEIESARTKRKQALLARQHALMGARTAEDWARRFSEAQSSGPPLRVLGITTRYSTVMQHALRDLAGAFQRAGCECVQLLEPDRHSNEIDTWTILAEQPFDLVILLNHLRAEMADRIAPGIPCVSWIQDHMVNIARPGAGNRVGQLDVVLTTGGQAIADLFGFPRKSLLHTNNRTDPVTFANEPVPASDLQRFACDVSFVSHGSETPEQMIEHIGRAQSALVPLFTGILRRLRKQLADHGWVGFMDRLAIMLDVEREMTGVRLTPAQRGGHVLPVVHALFDRLLRHETLDWTARWAKQNARTLRIYGRGWQQHHTLSAHAAGEVANGYDLRCLYQASHINLQVNGYGSLHQRLLDGIASGGLMLTRFNPNDFARDAAIALRDLIASEGIDSLAELCERASTSQTVADAVSSYEQSDLHRVAPMHDSERLRQVQLLRDVCGYEESRLNDSAMFESLKDMRYLPARAAGEIPRFAETTFRDEKTLHTLLDRWIDARQTDREDLVNTMRADVLKHDTFDVLVPQILARFTDSAKPAGVECACH